MSGFHLGQGDQFIGRDGQVRQYTNIDWTPKTSVTTFISTGELKTTDQIKQEMITELIDTVYAGVARPEWDAYTKVVDNKIVWDEDALKELSLDAIMDRIGLLRNRMELIKNI